MGFRGKTPYTLTVKQGALDSLQYIASCTAAAGGVGGTCENPGKTELLTYVPLVIKGLNPLCAAALWRSDAENLEYFGVWYGTGYVPFKADASVDFFAGNVATCDARLSVSVVEWTKDVARFRVHNPTRGEIITDFATVPAFKGYKAVAKSVTVKPGTSVDVTAE